MVHSNSHHIGDTELLLTDRGTIYHLDMYPEQLADIIITVGDPARVKEVSKYFDKITSQTAHREFIAHTGILGNKQITVVSTGIGPDNIDIVLNELDALANIDFATKKVKEQHRTLNIIRLGTCGGLQPNIPVDKVIASTYAIGMDNLLHYYRYTQNTEEAYILNEFVQHTKLNNNKYITPYITEASRALSNHFLKDTFNGITVTCPGFFGPQSRILRAPLALPNLLDALSTFNSRDLTITNFEMETAALYGLGKILGHRCLSLSVVINNRTNNTVSKNIQSAIDQMIQKALSVIHDM